MKRPRLKGVLEAVQALNPPVPPLREVEWSSASYITWIKRQYPTPRAALMQCSSASLAMCAAFPKLRRARGRYIAPDWGPREHWWCVAPDGEIVDPTAHQFPGTPMYPEPAPGRYEELPADAPEPIGECMICGSYCWAGTAPHANACSPECAHELEMEYR